MITAAAIRHDNQIYTGSCHADVMLKNKLYGKDYDEGFVNERGEFLTREQAAKHAYEAGQIKEKKPLLFSYDMGWK